MAAVLLDFSIYIKYKTIKQVDRITGNPIRQKAWNYEKLAKGTIIFHSEIPFGNFGLPFKKSRFPEKIPFGDDEQSFVSRSNYHISKRRYF